MDIEMNKEIMTPQDMHTCIVSLLARVSELESAGTKAKAAFNDTEAYLKANNNAIGVITDAIMESSIRVDDCCYRLDNIERTRAKVVK